jgi:hypothetical protein
LLRAVGARIRCKGRKRRALLRCKEGGLRGEGLERCKYDMGEERRAYGEEGKDGKT